MASARIAESLAMPMEKPSEDFRGLRCSRWNLVGSFPGPRIDELMATTSGLQSSRFAYIYIYILHSYIWYIYICMFAYIYICLHSWNPFVLFVFLQTNVFFPIWVYRFTSVFLLLEGSPAMKPLLNCETSGVLMSISSSGFCGKTCRTGNPVFWDRLFLSKNDWLVGGPNKFRINILWIKYVEVWWRYNYEIITWWSLSFTKFFHRPSRFCWFLIISSHRNFFHPLQGLNLQVQKKNWMTFSPKCSASKVPSYHWFHGVSLHV